MNNRKMESINVNYRWYVVKKGQKESWRHFWRKSEAAALKLAEERGATGIIKVTEETFELI